MRCHPRRPAPHLLGDRPRRALGGPEAVRGRPGGVRGGPRVLSDPISRFRELYGRETALDPEALAGACCLSTLGLDGLPNARFVALKEVAEGGFVCTGPLASRKAREMQANPGVALTFWWPRTGVQVRVQGRATPISREEAHRHFQARPREARLAARASEQGSPLADPAELEAAWDREERAWRGRPVPRPEGWGGWRVEPVRIEFLEFSDRRLHTRTLYSRTEAGWSAERLQP